ncbi:MAG: HAD family hydrolase [Alphaproteobacteria bacterium]
MTIFLRKGESHCFAHRVLGVVFDNDLTLYREGEANSLHMEAAIDAIRALIPDLQDRSKIEDLIQESRQEYGGSLEIFTYEYGVPAPDMRNEHYRQMIQKANTATFFDMQTTPLAGLRQLKENGIPTAIATHGNLEWTAFTLEKTGIAALFDRETIVTKDDVPEGKSVSTKMFEEALDRLGAPQTQDSKKRGIGYIMVEDTPKNLKNAKDLGMTTVLISPDFEPDADMPEYVDVVAKDVHTAIECILASNAPCQGYAMQPECALG